MSPSGFLASVNPADLEAKGPRPDELLEAREQEALGELVDEEDEFTPSIETIHALLDMLPPREADLITLYFVHNKRQAEISAMFGITQAAVSYRITRALKRIRFLLAIPRLTQDDLERDLPLVFPITPAERKKWAATGQDHAFSLDVRILVLMWATTCQSVVASRLNQTQGLVRHRFFAAIRTLEKAAADNTTFEPYHQLYSMIGDRNFNVLREVKLPQWSTRGQDICM